MIKIKGPQEVEPGSTVCVTASNIGSGFSAKIEAADPSVVLKITIDPVKHTATLCFVAPSGGSVVTIHATDNTVPKGTSFAIFSK